jgi:hypothetical protein
MGLIDRLRSSFAPMSPEEQAMAAWTIANIGGRDYGPFPSLNQTLVGPEERIADDYVGLASGAYQGNGIVFACLNARMSLFKQARFMWRQLRSGTPGDLWSSAELDILRTPWPNGTTADLLSRMTQDADLGGDSITARLPGRLFRARPDWVTVIHGSRNDANAGAWDPESELVGYVYQPGGPMSQSRSVFWGPEQVAHFAPIPNPLSPARGMSWLTPLIREVEADSAATSHKLMYFRNGATPNLVVTNVPGSSPETFAEWVTKFGKGHDGVKNAYKTLYLSGQADAKVIGNDLAQVDFKVTQGAGETRIAAAAGVPPIVVGLSEGLQGSSLNAGNFSASMRRFADLTGRSWWADAAGSLASILTVPGANELWYDDRFVPALKDDVRDAAEVQMKQAQAIRQYVDAGFEPDSVVAAINAGDLKLLQHTGLYSVQLQPPGTGQAPEAAAAPAEPMPDAMAARMAALEARPLAQVAAAPDVIFGTGAIQVTVEAPAPAVLEPLVAERAEGVTRIVYDDDGRIVEIVEGDA